MEKDNGFISGDAIGITEEQWVKPTPGDISGTGAVATFGIKGG